ncbi:hypothetical protein SPI_04111 [Niveomyces insectorum RCEF 264]|uniref:Uncharacterized protein n=1 Tax=Niveomyces insectorum RCEF 264 TaxID=1081102 RepID=A0A167VFY4_9HYPO|nr:hypothetical protein SPI_04111 [Niveomyces insectorum RCEF 264]
MKAVSIIVGALAAVVSAAPAKEVEARTSFDLSQLNNLAFSNQNFQYLNIVNSLDLQLLSQLGSTNNFNILSFQNLFQSNSFDLNALLEFQQLQMVLQLAQLGLFNGFDLSSLNFNSLNFGLINSVSSFDVNSIVDQSLAPQIAQVIQTGVVVTK